MVVILLDLVEFIKFMSDNYFVDIDFNKDRNKVELLPFNNMQLDIIEDKVENCIYKKLS